MGLDVAVVLDLTAAEVARNDEVENVVCNLWDDRPGDPVIETVAFGESASDIDLDHADLVYSPRVARRDADRTADRIADRSGCHSPGHRADHTDGHIVGHIVELSAGHTAGPVEGTLLLGGRTAVPGARTAVTDLPA